MRGGARALPLLKNLIIPGFECKCKNFMEETKKWGGAREGAGRKKTAVKQVAFRAPEDVADVLSRCGKATDYILAAIREKAERDGLL